MSLFSGLRVLSSIKELIGDAAVCGQHGRLGQDKGGEVMTFLESLKADIVTAQSNL